MKNGRPRILVVGSFVADRIVRTSRFPLAGETVLGDSVSLFPGGKGFNQAVQAARLGADVVMAGRVGLDADGDSLLATAQREGVDVENVVRSEVSTAMGIVTVFDDGCSVQNRIIVIPGANMELRLSDIERLREHIAGFDALLLQLEIPMEVNVAIARLAADAGVPVLLNPAPAARLPRELIERVDFLLPNETEAAYIADMPAARNEGGFDAAAIRNAALRLKALGAGNVLITLGDKGSYCITSDGEHSVPCAAGIDAVDPTAAGDSYIAAFAVELSRGESVKKAMETATLAAGITVTRMGGQSALPTRSDIEAFYGRRI